MVLKIAYWLTFAGWGADIIALAMSTWTKKRESLIERVSFYLVAGQSSDEHLCMWQAVATHYEGILPAKPTAEKWNHVMVSQVVP